MIYLSKKSMSKEMYEFLVSIKDDVSYDLEKGIIKTPKGTNGTLCSSTGYLRFRKNNRLLQVHQFLAVLYFGEKCIGMQVNHIDGNKLNNKRSNLEVVSQKDNLKHQFDYGLNAKGSDIGTSKLKESEVLEIRKLKKDGLSMYRIAKMYNVGETCIANIIHRKTWTHI